MDLKVKRRTYHKPTLCCRLVSRISLYLVTQKDRSTSKGFIKRLHHLERWKTTDLRGIFCVSIHQNKVGIMGGSTSPKPCETSFNENRLYKTTNLQQMQAVTFSNVFSFF